MLKPQGKGNDGMKERSEYTCALGAAADACGLMLPSYIETYSALQSAFPILKLTVSAPPLLEKAGYFLMSERVLGWCWRMNDRGISREQIADWVATIEAQHPEIGAPAEESSESPRVAKPVFVLEAMVR